MFVLFCVCFFKQKTAYEMRISDWSSDVCSSDLGLAAVPADLAEYQIIGTNGVQANDLVFRKIGRDGGQSAKAFITEMNDFGERLVQEIGRASCRERVCQYE